MGWFFSLLLIFLSIGSYYLTDNNNQTIQRMKLLPAKQEAIEFIHFANVINDYLYKYPDKRNSGGTLTSEQIGITPFMIFIILFTVSEFISGLPIQKV